MSEIQASADLTGLVKEWARDARDYELIKVMVTTHFAREKVYIIHRTGGDFLVRFPGGELAYPTFVEAFSDAMSRYNVLIQSPSIFVPDELDDEAEEPAEEPPVLDEPVTEPTVVDVPETEGYMVQVPFAMVDDEKKAGEPSLMFAAWVDPAKKGKDVEPTNLKLIPKLKEVGIDVGVLYVREGHEETLDTAKDHGLQVLLGGRYWEHDVKDVAAGRYTNEKALLEHIQHPAVIGTAFGDDFNDRNQTSAVEMKRYYELAKRQKTDSVVMVSGRTSNKPDGEGGIQDNTAFDWTGYQPSEVGDVNFTQVYLDGGEHLGWITSAVAHMAGQWQGPLGVGLPIYENRKGYIPPPEHILPSVLAAMVPRKACAFSFYTANHENGDWLDEKFQPQLKELKKVIALVTNHLERFYFYGKEVLGHGIVPDTTKRWTAHHQYLRGWQIGNELMLFAVNGDLSKAWNLPRLAIQSTVESVKTHRVNGEVSITRGIEFGQLPPGGCYVATLTVADEVRKVA